MRVFHSKHQKLILQCYPPGKGVDKKPNPSELSYLLYYASTRRVKLEKVIEFLKHKTRADARSRKSGNLSVTLSIVSALIDKCFENLNAFAPQVCTILHTVLVLKELPLCKALASTFCVFCAHLDNGLFAGDKGFVDSFSALTQDLISLAESQSALQATNHREWKMISLLTCRHVFSCLGYNSQLRATILPRSVAILAPTVSAVFSLESLSARLKATLNLEQGASERLLSKTLTAKSTVHVDAPRESLEEDSVTDSDLGEEALAGLRTLFHTSLSNQISEATKSVVEYDFRHDHASASASASAWGTTFFQICASFIPVQLRFETLLTLLDTLSAITNGAKKPSDSFLHMRHYAKYILSLVSSGFNMIGLSISDILLQLLTLKTNLYLHLSQTLPEAQVTELSVIYSECICNLAGHIYYFDQVSDSIEGILMQVDSVLVLAEQKHALKVGHLVLDLLEIIGKISALVSVNSSAISWNHLTLENWDISFQLLTFNKSYPGFVTMVSRQSILRIQSKYLEVFQGFLDRELTIIGTKSESNDEADGLTKFLEPNYKNYIEDRGNTLNALLLHCGDYFNEDSFDATIAKALSKVLGIIADVTGVNFAHNFLSFFGVWQLQKPPMSMAEVAKDLCAYYVLTTTISALNKGYSDLLGEDISESSLSSAISRDIERRRKDVWGADSNSSLLPETNDASFADQISVGGIEEFFAQTPLKQWLFSPNTILVEFENGEGHKLPRAKFHGGTSNLESDEISLGSALPYPGSRLGLGTANDISSIYSGLQNGHGGGNGKTTEYTPDTSQITQATLHTHRTQGFHDPSSYKRFLMPKVEDLKRSVDGLSISDHRFMLSGGMEPSSAHSILSKPAHITDVMSILDDLKSEDDREIIV
ncbi:hypothetical protein JCM33374_g5605 [Metschnikowia sp. JCM 33374]|nr:hypothetical protein JCM33374_g5605 [Metschnikowia sp. JCM 33374]